jgi:isopentenyldiphosphate isomerase
LPHRSAYILVFNRKGDLFIHLRTSTKDVYPSYWDVCVGGVLAAGESHDEAARREMAEELGLVLDPERLFPYLFRDSIWIVHGMVYRIIHDGPFQLQPEEIVRGEFVSVDEVTKRAAKDPFCPDGLSVFTEYWRRCFQ